MKEITINVNGMHCGSCEMLIKDALEDEDAIESAKLSHSDSTAIVFFDENKIDEEKIKSIIREEGFGVN